MLDIDDLVMRLDQYEDELELLLSDAYWNDKSDEVEALQAKVRTLKVLRALGETYWTAF